MNAKSPTAEIERRLRDDLPRLAEALLDHSPDRAPAPPISPEADRSRRRPGLIVAAAAVAVLAVGSVLVGLRLRDEPGTTRIGAAGPVDPIAVPTGTWQVMSESPLEPRQDALMVWTGDELVVWGGHRGLLALSDGAAYDPSTDRWRPITPNAWAHPGAVGVWTGSEVVVLAKTGGAAFDPMTETWRDLPTIDGWAGARRAFRVDDQVVAVSWVSSEVPGSGASVALLGDDAENWDVGVWLDEPIAPDASATLIGSEVVVWSEQSGWSYDVDEDRWRQLPELTAPEGWTVAGTVIGTAADSLVVFAELTPDTATTSAATPETAETATVAGTAAMGPGGWTWAVSSGPVELVEPLVSPAGDLAVLTGARSDGKATVFVTGGVDAARLEAYPLAALTGQSVVWTGRELVLWGGRLADPEDGSGSPGEALADGAIWVPDR